MDPRTLDYEDPKTRLRRESEAIAERNKRHTRYALYAALAIAILVVGVWIIGACYPGVG